MAHGCAVFPLSCRSLAIAFIINVLSKRIARNDSNHWMSASLDGYVADPDPRDESRETAAGI
jgi:hypothetical protein